MLHRRRHLVGALLASAGLLAGAAAGCAALSGPPVLRLSEAELAAMARRAFPVERRLLDVLDTRLSHPRLRLLAEPQRIAAQLELGARERVFGGTWQGELDFDAALQWDASAQALRLRQVRVQDLRLLGRGDEPPTAGERLGAAVAERMLEGFVLYRLPAERAAELQRQGLRPDAVTVTPRGVEITFKALPRP